MKARIILFVTFLTLVTVAVADEWARTSPFRDIKVQGSYIFVDFEGIFYQIKEIDGHTHLEIIKAAKAKFKANWEKRIIEDLPEALEAAGSSASFYKPLTLQELGTGKLRRVSRAKFTAPNRREIMRRRRFI